MIKELEACQCEMWFDGKGGILVGDSGGRQVVSKSVCKITHRTLLLCSGLYCAPEEVLRCGPFEKSLYFSKVYQRTMYIPTLNLHFASFVLHKMGQRSNFARFLSQRYRV